MNGTAYLLTQTTKQLFSIENPIAVAAATHFLFSTCHQDVRSRDRPLVRSSRPSHVHDRRLRTGHTRVRPEQKFSGESPSPPLNPINLITFRLSIDRKRSSLKSIWRPSSRSTRSMPSTSFSFQRDGPRLSKRLISFVSSCQIGRKHHAPGRLQQCDCLQSGQSKVASHGFDERKQE